MTNAQFMNLSEKVKEILINEGEDVITFEISEEADEIVLQSDSFSIVFYPDGTFSTYEDEDDII
jgi:phage baseplate assembly protein gpV